MTEHVGTQQPDTRASQTIMLCGVFDTGREANHQLVGAVEEILRAGLMASEFRRVAFVIMASVIQRAIEGLPIPLANDFGLNAER